MKPNRTTITAIAATATIALGAAAGSAQARHGADDAQPHAKGVQKHRHHHHARHGADDGPNHT